MIQPNYEYTVYYIFLETYLCVICLFHVMYWYYFCSFLWNKRLCSLFFFFFGSVLSFRICTAVFIKIFVIIYSNIFFLYCSKTIFFFWSFLSYIVIQNFVLFVFCSVCFCSTNIALQFFVLFDITKCLFKYFFSFLYCSLFFLLVSYLLQLFVSFIFKFCIKKKKKTTKAILCGGRH